MSEKGPGINDGIPKMENNPKEGYNSDNMTGKEGQSYNNESISKNKTERITEILVGSDFLKRDENESSKLDEVFEILGHGHKSVEDMDETITDPNKTEAQRKIAEDDKKILNQAVCLAIEKTTITNPNLKSEFFLGSKHIENMFDPGLKELGKEISKKYINDEQIDRQLNLLEITRKNTDSNDSASKETFKQKIDRTINKLSQIDFDDEEKVMEQDAVLTILNGEKRKYSSKNSFSKRNEEDYDFEPPTIDPENQEFRGGARWEISPENAAMAMKFMDSGMRWQSYTPPEWMKKLDGETQARIEYMVMVNDGAASLSYAGKDLDKIQGNKMYFAFDNEKMTKLFNPDFKLVMSKMLNDLCEFDKDKNGNEVDKNGKKSIRYKEGLNKEGKQGIKADVEKKLENIRDYKEELATFLAKQNGRKESNYMDKMNAYTAWNLFYMFGDSSVADRRRVLPTYGGIISDGLRTLNPEYKALGKWKISKADERKSDLEGAEWFGGPLGVYVQTVMQLERDLGHDGKDKPITGNKTLRDKIMDGEISILLNTKTFYGFLDFTSGGRDLYDKNGDKFYDKDNGKKREETLSSLLMNYASFDKDGNLINKNENNEFSFGNNQVDFLNWYRDQMEASALVLNATTGKEDVKNIGNFVSKIRTAFGMVDGISINGKQQFNYTKNPDLWANMLLGSFGVDTTRLSTDCIYIRTTQPQSYSLNVGHFITRGLKLSNHDVNLTTLMRHLGVDIKDGENIDSLSVTLRNEQKWKNAKKITDDLIKRSHRRQFN